MIYQRRNLYEAPAKWLPASGQAQRLPFVHDPCETHSLAPAEPLFVVGDVHGRIDLLEPLLMELLNANARIVLVGDYIDRGPESAATLALLQQALSQGYPLTCLMGNHEAMLLKFLAMPESMSAWLCHGGRETLTSFGLSDTGVEKLPVHELRRLATALRQVIPDAILSFLRALPTHYQSGNVFVSHAGTNADMPLDRQSARQLLWGHRCTNSARACGTWVVQGHIVQRKPMLSRRHISLDTGAFSTGRLTVAEIRAGSVEFFEA